MSHGRAGPHQPGTSHRPSQEQDNWGSPSPSIRHVPGDGTGQGQAWMSAHGWGGSGLTRGTSVRHSPTMVGQGCKKRTLACRVRAHSPAQLGGVGHLRGPWPKVADEGCGWPCHSFPLAMLGCLPCVVSQSKVLRAPARVLLSLPMFYHYQGGSAALGAPLVCTYMSLAYFKCPFFTNVVF